MTNTAPQTTITLEQCRAMLQGLHDRMDKMEAAMETMGKGLAQAASAPQYVTFRADEIILTYSDEGEPRYKVKGEPYKKFGVQLWPEVLETLPIDVESLQPGSNPIDLELRAILKTYTDEESGEVKTTPKKIVGLA